MLRGGIWKDVAYARNTESECKDDDSTSNQNQTHELQEIKPKHDHYIVTWLCRGISGIREGT